MASDGKHKLARESPVSSGPARGGGAGGYAAAGLEFALVLVLFAFAGQWLDRRLGTAPWLLTLSIFLGGGGAFYGMVRALTAAQDRRDAGRSTEDSRE